MERVLRYTVHESMVIELLRQTCKLGVIEQVLYAVFEVLRANLPHTGDKLFYRRAHVAQYEIDEYHPDGHVQNAGSEHNADSLHASRRAADDSLRRRGGQPVTLLI